MGLLRELGFNRVSIGVDLDPAVHARSTACKAWKKPAR
jgi:coproporphyrinogen III oxidase-like Fe-S oxidoreductase